jgi:uncharacterized protein (DUF488 family)
VEEIMTAVPIYTIGYGNRSIEDFVRLLQVYGIKFLVDLRSQPYSRYKPEFSKVALEQYLQHHQFRYVYMGDMLGGRPEDAGCYTEDGKIDYTILCEKDFYRRGINRLRTAWEKQLRIALMCSELKPQECHRGKLVGNTLVEEGLAVLHIDETGNIKTQDEVNQFFAIEQASGQLSFLDVESQVTLNQKTGRSRKKHTPTKASA